MYRSLPSIQNPTLTQPPTIGPTEPPYHLTGTVCSDCSGVVRVYNLRFPFTPALADIDLHLLEHCGPCLLNGGNYSAIVFQNLLAFSFLSSLGSTTSNFNSFATNFDFDLTKSNSQTLHPSAPWSDVPDPGKQCQNLSEPHIGG